MNDQDFVELTLCMMALPFLLGLGQCVLHMIAEWMHGRR